MVEPPRQRPQCLIIVPREEPELQRRLVEHFAGDGRIVVRADARTGDRVARDLGVFAVGGGDLSAELEAQVREQIRVIRASL